MEIVALREPRDFARRALGRRGRFFADFERKRLWRDGTMGPLHSCAEKQFTVPYAEWQANAGTSEAFRPARDGVVMSQQTQTLSKRQKWSPEVFD